MTEFVTYETAKLAKQKGFNGSCNGYFVTDFLKTKDENNAAVVKEEKFFTVEKFFTGENMYTTCNQHLSRSNHRLQPQIITMPFQCDLQKWLRDNHNYHIEIGKDEEYWKYSLYEISHGNKHIPRGFPQFNTYELALEEGLIEVLKLI